MNRTFKSCTLTRGLFNANGWWKEFGLDSNPYVYGPMPPKRTSQFYRMQEARRMGWMSWIWVDEYTDERKGLFQKSRKKYNIFLSGFTYMQWQ